MAVTFQATATGTATSGTSVSSASLDASAGTDQCLIATVGSSDDAAQNPTGITWDVASPQNFTSAVSVTAASFYGVGIWYLVGITAATDTATATYGSTCDEMALTLSEFEGVDQTTPTGNTQNTSATTASVSVTLTSVNANDMCIDNVLQDRSGGGPWTLTPGANQTERAEIATGGAYSIGLAISTQAGSDGGVMSYDTTPTSGQKVYCAAVIKEAAGGGGGASTIYNCVSSGGVVGAGNSFITGSGGAVG